MVKKDLKPTAFFDPASFQHFSVGQRLREIRTAKGYSIKSLAKKSGLAVNTLSLIENQKSSPSVSTMEALAKALEIPLARFFEPSIKSRKVVLTRSESRRELLLEGIRVEDIGLQLDQKSLQPFIVTLESGRGSGDTPIVHTGVELIYCLSGKVEYFIEGKKYGLNPGDSLLFKAHLPHRWVNNSDEPVVYLLIMVPEGTADVPSGVHFISHQ